MTGFTVTDNNLLEQAEGRRMAVEIISQSISTKVWDWAEIELGTSGSAVRHVTDCAMWSGNINM